MTDRARPLLPAACLAVLLVLAGVDRAAVLWGFAFETTDNDQVVMWHGAKDFLAGELHEPCFYGQPYNSMLEALLAVPWIASGAPYDLALPLMTALLAVCPFLLFAGIALAAGRPAAAALVLVLLLALPVEYAMLTSMPRGFVTGTFCASLIALDLFVVRRGKGVLAGFLAVLSLSLNPNAALLAGPLVLWLVLSSPGKLRASLLVAAGALPAGVLHFLSRRFYDVHPEYRFYGRESLAFSFDHLADGLNGLDRFLGHVTPVFWGRGWALVALLAVLAALFARRRAAVPAVVAAAGLVAVLLSLGVDKVHDGEPSIFYSWSRMYVAVPVLLAFLVSRLEVPARRAVHVTAAAALLGVLFFVVKLAGLGAAVERSLPTGQSRVAVMRTADLYAVCQGLAELSERHGVDLVVLANYVHLDLVNYGCPCVVEGLPETFLPGFERRTWKIEEIGAGVYEDVLFWGGLPESVASRQLEVLPEAPAARLLRGNKATTFDVLRVLGMPIREGSRKAIAAGRR